METFVSPMLSKDAVKYITANITPEDAQYVADVKSIYNNAKLDDCSDIECEDILFVNKIIAFADKFRALHWAAPNMSYHTALDEFHSEIESYKDAIAENIQSIIGQFKGSEFQELTLPISNNPLDVINELKICVNNFLELHSDDVEYEGCRNATSTFLEAIHKYIYVFRLCKD